jgi:AraC-like DNA-binding protein
VHLINHYKNDVAVKEAFEKREKTLQRMRALFDFVEDHYQEPITLARATAVVGMSKAHFMRSFKKVTGQSFDTYLNHFRIHKAQALLASSDKAIFTVSREVGFCDQSYFGLVFRRLVRVTPREYRRQFS